MGANLGLAGLFGGDLDSPLQVEFIGERTGRPGGAADHRVTLFGIINFGSRPHRACNPAVAACTDAEASAEQVPRAPRRAGARGVPPEARVVASESHAGVSASGARRAGVQ